MLLHKLFTACQSISRAGGSTPVAPVMAGHKFSLATDKVYLLLQGKLPKQFLALQLSNARAFQITHTYVIKIIIRNGCNFEDSMGQLHTRGLTSMVYVTWQAQVLRRRYQI